MGELKLPQGMALTPLNPTFRDHPHALLDQLREVAPVHVDSQFERLYLTRYADIRTVLNDRSLAVDPRRRREGSFMRRMTRDDDERSMLQLDDPDHRRLRGLVAQAFNQRSIEAMRPRIRQVATTLLDGLADAPSFELIGRYAGPLPTIVIAEMLGVDAADQALFKHWSDGLVQVFNPAPTEAQRQRLNEASQGLLGYLANVVEQRRRSPREDLVSALVAAEEAGERLTAREIVTTCNLLLFDIERADTTHASFGGGVHFCLGAPLARAEAQIGIGLLLERFPALALDPARPAQRKTAPTFNGLEALWLRTATG